LLNVMLQLGGVKKAQQYLEQELKTLREERKQ